MEESGFYNVADVVVGKAVNYVFTRLTVGYKRCLAQSFYLMGNGRASHTEEVGNITYAHRALIDSKKNAHSGRVSKYLKEIGKIIEGFRIGHLFLRRVDNISVYFLALADGGVYVFRHFILLSYGKRLNKCSTVLFIIALILFFVNTLINSFFLYIDIRLILV